MLLRGRRWVLLSVSLLCSSCGASLPVVSRGRVEHEDAPALAELLEAGTETTARRGAAPDTGSKKAGSGSLTARLSYYRDLDGTGDGNPFLDEDLTVIEPVVVLDYNVTDRFSTWAKFGYDYVSAASIDRLSSGASTDNYFGLDLGARYEVDPDLRVGGFVHGSTEWDYKSVGVGADVSRDLAGDNTTVGLDASVYLDELDKITRFDGTRTEPDRHRVSASSTASWYQVVNPFLHGQLGYTFGYQNGFLETPYNAVVVEDPALPPNPDLDNKARGVEVTEELEGTRLRNALFGRLRQYLHSLTAVELGGRLYADDWGIASVTVEPQLHQWLVERVLRARLRYRFYVQSAADDFDDHFRTIERHRTQDSDLGNFLSHGVGLEFQWYVSERVTWDLGGDFVHRSDGIVQVFSSMGVTWQFR